MAINVLGEAKGNVILFETVVPICPPACDGYNYSSEGGITPSTQWSLTIILLISLLILGKRAYLK